MCNGSSNVGQRLAGRCGSVALHCALHASFYPKYTNTADLIKSAEALARRELVDSMTTPAALCQRNSLLSARPWLPVIGLSQCKVPWPQRNIKGLSLLSRSFQHASKLAVCTARPAFDETSYSTSSFQKASLDFEDEPAAGYAPLDFGMLMGSSDGATFVVSGGATVSLPVGAVGPHTGGASTFILPPGAVVTMPAGSGEVHSGEGEDASLAFLSSQPSSSSTVLGHTHGEHLAADGCNGNSLVPAGHRDPMAAATVLPLLHGGSRLQGDRLSPSQKNTEQQETSDDEASSSRRGTRDGGASREYHAHLANRCKATPLYSRVMLKVSGEALQGRHGFGMDPDVLRMVAKEVKAAYVQGVEICIVVGGGNYFRGASAWEGLNRATADYVGMLATVMNALCLQAALEQLKVPTRVQTAIEMREVAEPYVQRRAIRHLEEGRVVIFGAGTGNPFFTTDTAAALRAAEMDADVFLKATKVDGVYDSDPMKNPDAKRYNKLSFKQVTLDDLRVMDQTAITLCKENNIPVIVFSIAEPGNVLRAARGEAVGTTVCCWDDAGEECVVRGRESGNS